MHFPLVSLSTSGLPEAPRPLKQTHWRSYQRLLSTKAAPLRQQIQGSWQAHGKSWGGADALLLQDSLQPSPSLQTSLINPFSALVLFGPKQVLSTLFEQINTNDNSGTSIISGRPVLPGRLTCSSAEFQHPQGAFLNSSLLW